jgi:Uma2 family endonuclease
MADAAIRGRMSYEAYLALEARSDVKLEYVDGWVVAMTGGTPTHARLAGRLTRILGDQLDGTPCVPYSADLKVHVAQANRSTYADVTVVCGEPKPSSVDRNAIENPVVLVEVLSSGTESDDRGAKWRDYQRLASLKHYVLVSQAERRIEVYSRQRGGWRYAEAAGQGSIALDAVGIELDVAAIYRGITLERPRLAPARGRDRAKRRAKV